MNNRILQVFYDDKCYPFKDAERQVRFPIVGNSFVGASNITSIRFYIDQIGSVDDTWVANSKLPNGKMGNEILSTKGSETINGVEEHYVELSLSTFYTQAKGDLYISLNSFVGGVEITEDDGIYSISGVPTIQATGSIKISIYYATPLLDGDEVDVITLQQLLAAISLKLGKDENKYLKVVDSIYSINTSAYDGYLFSNDVIYSISGKKFYILSGEYPTLVATEIALSLGSLDVNTLNVNYLNVIDFENVYDDSNDIYLPDYIKELADILDQFVFQMTSNPMSLTDTQYNKLINNHNIRIIYTYSGRTYLFDKVRTNYNNQDLYISNCRIDEYVGSGAGQYDKEQYVAISLDRVNKRLGAAVIQRTLYLKNQVDELLNLKADKSNTYTKDEIDTRLTSMLIYKGSKTVSQLNDLATDLGEQQCGFFYNVSDSGTLEWTASGITYTLEVLAGDNVCWTGSGWDKLTMDLSVYDDKFIAAGFFEVQNYNENTGEITFVYSSDLYDMSYNSNTGILTIEAN